jgi:uncharacterized protein with NAD-binding domain and iron-sulfur cluster
MAKVIVIGGGIGGLTTAHELAERGFDVHVYESRGAFGGKARTEPVLGTGTGGRRDLPGEHGFRFYPSFYRHVIDMMARTPVAEGSRETVDSRLRPCTEVGVASVDDSTWSTTHRRRFAQPRDVIDAAQVFFDHLGFHPTDAALFGLKILQYLTACDERRLGEYEAISWWDFLGVEGYSRTCHERANWVPRMLVAMDAKQGNARTVGNTSMQLLLDFTTSGSTTDRTLAGPTSEMWIEPWTARLKTLGVQFHAGETCTSLDVANGRISGVRFASGALVRGGQYVLAVPIEAASALMSADLAALDPQCERLRTADVDRLVSWMVGIQFYLRRDVRLARGHMVFPNAPWALTAISQPQFWEDTVGPFRDHYGDGDVAGLISVDISQWDIVGNFVRKTARECTPEEVKTEVWNQLKAALNGARPDQQTLTDDLLHSWHLDDDVDYSGGTPPVNHSRLLIHPTGSWAVRPEAASAVPNLCFASDYVRTYTDIASMEGACEAGRRAANVILDREGSSADRVAVWAPEEPREFEAFRRMDRDFYRRGRPHPFEVMGVRHAFQAVDLLRRVSNLPGATLVEDLLREFKVADAIGDFLNRFNFGR